MSIGPFTTYAPPAAYTQTVIEPVIAQLLGGLRVPVLIGPAKETLSQSNFEMIRGSSSLADTPIFGEDVSGRWIVSGTNQNPILGNQDGSRLSFRVRNYPIVDGSGINRVTYDISKISVVINGEATVISQIDGTNGTITLLAPPSSTDIVSVNYYFRRKDTIITDDLSGQVTVGAAALVAPKAETYTITAGTNDELRVYVNDANIYSSVSLTVGTRSAVDVANDINLAAVNGLTATVHTDNQGFNHVQLNAQGNLLIGDGTANTILGFSPGASSSRNRVFRTFNGPIVDGSDGGITTTDTSRVTVLVNNLQVIPVSVDGANRLITLAQAPVSGSVVRVTYWFNTYQDTFDYLPNSNIVTVGNVGIAPDRRDFLNGPDFVITNEGDQSKILWGTAWQVVSGEITGNTSFDSVQMTGLLVDDRIYGVACDRYVDTVNNLVSSTKFVLPIKPTTGNGRDTPLGQTTYRAITNGRIDLPTNRPDLITVYIGKSFRDAYSRPPVTVLEVNSTDNTFVLKNQVPADYNAYATFWYNRIVDDVYTLKVTASGPSGIGKYQVTSQLNNNINLHSVRFGTKNALPQIVQWPSGVEIIPDALHYGGQPVSETVTVAFSNTLLPAKHASFSNLNPDPYDIYTYSQMFGGIRIDGGAPFSVNLSTAFSAQLVSQPISDPAALVFLSSDRLVFQIDGIILVAVDVSAMITVTAVAAAINAVIDADTQVHADGSGTFASTAPNALASVVTYGTEQLLKVVGRNVPSATNGLISNVRVLTPTTVGQTDASAKVGLLINQESVGSYNALNQPAVLAGTQDSPFSITTGINDSFLFSIDGQDYNTTLPVGPAVTLEAVVNTINASYAGTGPSTDQAIILAQAIVVANEIRDDYNTAVNNHIGNVPAIFHTVADAVNTIVAPAASDLATLIALLIDLKAKINAHFANTGGAFHTVADTANIITQADPTNLETAVVSVYRIKTAYNAHRTAVDVHDIDDTINITTASNAELVAQQGAGQYLDQLVLISCINTPDSGVAISTLGTANVVLGFSSGAIVNRIQPTATRIAAALNDDAAFNAVAVAYPVSTTGRGTFLRIDSLAAGVGSIVAFTSVANTAFVTDTGVGIIPGTSGDVGEAAQSGFSVTSSSPSGSSGMGTPGQTYTDARTGLRFTVLPASAGDYATGGSFTLTVNSTFTADASIPTRSVPGLELSVFNTINVGVDSTAVLTTFNRGGAEPAVGDIYYVSYEYAKTNLATALYRDLRKIQQSFGPPTPEYPLSLAARLSLLNGSVLVGLKQVLREPSSSQASVASYADAIDEQRKPIEGSVKPDVLVALTTDVQVYSLLNQHCLFMSTPRQEGERISVVGMGIGTTPTGARTIAQNLQSEVMIATYPDQYILTVQDALGSSFDQLVDSTYMAAALAGSSTSPNIDVATPWTRRQVVGFKKLGRILDPTEANQIAVAGVTVVEQSDAGLRIRHGLTTKIDNVITRTPSVILTIHYVQQQMRKTLDPYIGQKLTGAIMKSIEQAITGLFGNLIDEQIVAKVAGIAVTVDENDPTIIRTSTVYVPVFPLEYIVSTLSVRVRI